MWRGGGGVREGARGRRHLQASRGHPGSRGSSVCFSLAVTGAELSGGRKAGERCPPPPHTRLLRGGDGVCDLAGRWPVSEDVPPRAAPAVVRGALWV